MEHSIASENAGITLPSVKRSPGRPQELSYDLPLRQTYASTFEMTYNVEYMRFRRYSEKGKQRIVIELRAHRDFNPIQVVNTSIEESREIRRCLNSITTFRRGPYRSHHDNKKTARR